MAKVLDGGRLGKGAFGPEVGNLQGPLQRQAGGHDFAENMGDAFAGQRAGIAFHDTSQHLGLTLRPIVHNLGLGFARARAASTSASLISATRWAHSARRLISAWISWSMASISALT